MLASSVGAAAAAAASASGCSFANNSFLFLFEKGGIELYLEMGWAMSTSTYGEVARPGNLSDQIPPVSSKDDC